MQKIFEHVTIAIAVSEPDYPNRLLYVNKAYCDLVGYSAEELLGINPGELLQRPPYNKAREFIRTKLNAYQPAVSLVLNYRKDGSAFWNEVHLNPVMEDGKCIYWIGTPIDVTTQIDKAAFELEALMHTLKQNIAETKSTIIERIVSSEPGKFFTSTGGFYDISK